MTLSVPPAAPPNVVLIYMDDMTHWALTSPQSHTPNLDRLVANGTTFTHALNQGSTQQAVCVPARQMLLTGLTVFHAHDHFEEVPRLGEVLGGSGYETFFTGKWHNGEAALWHDYERVGPWAEGMLVSTGLDGDAYGRPAPGNTWDPADRSRGGHWLRDDDGRVRHSSERWADAAVGFLKQPHERPFLLHLAFHAPHDPRQAPQEYLDLYPVEEVEVPPNAWPAHPFDNGELDVRDELLAPFPRTAEAVRRHRREYLAILSHADAQIGRVLDALDQRGLAGNTLVVFSADHGLALGEHGLMGKQNPYDHSIRVPLVLAGPGVPRGMRIDGLVYSGSILPTVCALAGVAPPPHTEFASLLPALAGTEPEPLDAVITVYRDLQRAVRTPTHKLVVYPATGRRQLFDLERDPWETEDLAGEPASTALVDALIARLQELQKWLDDPLGPVAP